MESLAQAAWNTPGGVFAALAGVHDHPGKMPSSRLLAEAGIGPGRPIALYCRGDVSATEGFVALRTAGVQTARVCGGSWTEWVADPAIPKRRGNG
jgi:thiosulfate/3-mercaptopyruvate sulfurtransferase